MRLVIAIAFTFGLSGFVHGEGYTLQDSFKGKPKSVTINIEVNGAGPHAPTEKHGFYACSVEAFTEKFEGTGKTETAAKFKAKQSCLAKHDEMFCKDLTCEGEDDSSGQWICRVKAFGESFEILADSKAEARYKVKKDCTAKNHEMHCSDISCEQ